MNRRKFLGWLGKLGIGAAALGRVELGNEVLPVGRPSPLIIDNRGVKIPTLEKVENFTPTAVIRATGIFIGPDKHESDPF